MYKSKYLKYKNKYLTLSDNLANSQVRVGQTGGLSPGLIRSNFIGLEVLAVKDSRSGKYSKGDRGIIIKKEPYLLVRWPKGEFPTYPDNIQLVPFVNKVRPSILIRIASFNVGGQIQCNSLSSSECFTVRRCQKAYKNDSIQCFYNSLQFLVDNKVKIAGLQETKHLGEPCVKSRLNCQNRFNFNKSNQKVNEILKDYNIYIPDNDTCAVSIIIHKSLGEFQSVPIFDELIRWDVLRGIACIYLLDYNILFLNIWAGHLGKRLPELFPEINRILEKHLDSDLYKYTKNTRIIMTMDSNDGNKFLFNHKLTLLENNLYLNQDNENPLKSCCEDRWTKLGDRCGRGRSPAYGLNNEWPGDYILDTEQGTTYIPELYDPSNPKIKWTKESQLMSDHLPIFYDTKF